MTPVTSATSPSSQVITGTVEADAAVRVSVNGGPLLPATVAGDTWSFNVPLTQASNEVSITATDGVGNTTTVAATIALPAGAPGQPSTITSPGNITLTASNCVITSITEGDVPALTFRRALRP